MRTLPAGLFLLPLLALPGGAFAYAYDVAPAPGLAPAAPSSGSPGPGGTGPAPLRVYLAPFRDPRRDKDLWRGGTSFERVAVEAEGLDAQPRPWGRDDYGSESFLWQRQLGQALAARGAAVAEAPAPFPDSGSERGAARASGARALLDGEILGLAIGKRGSDGLFGTDFSGVDYTFTLQLRLRLSPLASGGKAWDQDWSFTHVFHDPTPLGRRDRDTFPVYFAQGLSLAAAALAGDAAPRLGLNPPRASAAPIRAPEGGYWANPKTGKRMDPAWNFDPSDGTPRRDFVWRPEASASAPPAASGLLAAPTAVPTARPRP